MNIYALNDNEVPKMIVNRLPILSSNNLPFFQFVVPLQLSQRPNLL